MKQQPHQVQPVWNSKREFDIVGVGVGISASNGNSNEDI